MAAPRLLGDIGGTNARFALQMPGAPPEAVRVLATSDHASLAAAVTAYLEETGPPIAPDQAAIAVASPVAGDHVELTNNAWSFTISETQRALGLAGLHVVNDFVAIALSILKLEPGDARQIGGGAAMPGTPVGVIGPGTGLGVSGLVPADTGWVPLATEGGHVTLPAVTAREDEVVRWLRDKYGHASAERAISGPGLVNLHGALCDIDGTAPERLTPDDITRHALDNTSAVCVEALEMFCAMLGTVAGDLALTQGARGGVFIAGGIVPDFVDAFAASRFRDRFEDKGRFRTYLAQIPTFVITRELPAFLGLAAVLDAAAAAQPAAS